MESEFDINKVQLGDSNFDSYQVKNANGREEEYEGGENEEPAVELPYLDLIRETGSGPVRIGNQIKLGSDVYSMLYASCFHHDLIHYYDKELNKSADQDDSQVVVFSDVNMNPFDSQRARDPADF